MPGIKFHYNSISKGVIDIRDIVYFVGVIVVLCLLPNEMLRSDKLCCAGVSFFEPGIGALMWLLLRRTLVLMNNNVAIIKDKQGTQSFVTVD